MFCPGAAPQAAWMRCRVGCCEFGLFNVLPHWFADQELGSMCVAQASRILPTAVFLSPAATTTDTPAFSTSPATWSSLALMRIRRGYQVRPCDSRVRSIGPCCSPLQLPCSQAFQLSPVAPLRGVTNSDADAVQTVAAASSGLHAGPKPTAHYQTRLVGNSGKRRLYASTTLSDERHHR